MPLSYPERVEAIHEGSHEIGHRGYIHERMATISESQQRMIMDTGMTILESLTGQRPAGYRASATSFGKATPGLLKDFDVVYDSSLMGDDVHPYWLRRGDEYSTYDPYVFGDDLDIVEMPWGRVISDLPYFAQQAGRVSPISATPQVGAAWREEFDYFAEHGTDGCLQFVLHPGLIGRGPRIEMLSRMIGEMTERGARFTTLLDASRRARTILPPRESRLIPPGPRRARHFVQ